MLQASRMFKSPSHHSFRYHDFPLYSARRKDAIDKRWNKDDGHRACAVTKKSMLKTQGNKFLFKKSILQQK